MTKLKQYRIEIFGYMDIDAKNRKEALNKAHDLFNSGELTHDDLSFDITYDEDEDNND